MISCPLVAKHAITLGAQACAHSWWLSRATNKIQAWAPSDLEAATAYIK